MVCVVYKHTNVNLNEIGGLIQFKWLEVYE